MSKTKIIILSVLGTVFVIIGILLVVSRSVDERLEKARSRASDTRINADLVMITRGLGYYDANGKYPPSLKELEPLYVPLMPLDRSTNKPYEYFLDNDQNYRLCPKGVSSENYIFMLKGQSCVKNSPVSQ